MPEQRLVPPTAVPFIPPQVVPHLAVPDTTLSGIANHPLKTPLRLPPQAITHQATAADVGTTAITTRTQLLQQLRNMRTLLGWRLRGRKAAVPRTNAQLQARLTQLQHWYNQRTGPKA